MAKPFKKEPQDKKVLTPETPYLRAKKEWDDRIGQSRVQAQNWRFFAFMLLILVILLLAAFVNTLRNEQVKVFVAEVTGGGRVVNVAPITVPYKPSVAQEEYFVTQVVKMIRSLSLDPVLTKQNLTNAYSFLTQASSQKLNNYLRANNPLKELGKKTITVKITDVNPISSNSFQIGWTETSFDTTGQVMSKDQYSGVFTITIRPPRSQKEILINPLGVYIADFNISKRT